MSMLLNRHMELLNIAELAPETITMFMGRKVAQNTHKKQRTMCRNSVNTKKLMYIQMFIVFHSKYKMYIFVVLLNE